MACSPLINWNDTPSHKQCIILQASETLQNAIVWVKYASTYHSKQVESAVGYWVCTGMKGDGLCLACKFQSRLRYPSGALADSQNQFGEGGLASAFLCFCFHLSLPFTLLSLRFITVFLLSPIHPLTSYLFIMCSLSHPLSGSVSFLLNLPPYHPCVFFFLCLSSSCNKSVCLFGGWWKMWSLVINAHCVVK